MDEKKALLQKMKIELENKRKKLERINRSVKIKNHIQNKIFQNETYASEGEEALQSLSYPLVKNEKSYIIENNSAESSLETMSNQNSAKLSNSFSDIDNQTVLKKQSDKIIEAFSPINNHSDIITNVKELNKDYDDQIKDINGIDLVGNINSNKENQNIDANCYFSMSSDENYYKFDFLKSSYFLKNVDILDDVIAICFDNSILIFSICNFNFSLIYQWNSHHLIKYVAIYSSTCFITILQASNKLNLIVIHSLKPHVSVKLQSSYTYYNDELKPAICILPRNKLFLVSNSLLKTYNKVYPLQEKYIFNENIVSQTQSIEENHSKSIINQLTFEDKESILSYDLPFSEVVSIMIIKFETILCISNIRGCILLWNYLTNSSLSLLETWIPSIILSDYIFYDKGLLFVPYEAKSSDQNILVLNPNGNAHIDLLQTKDKFLLWNPLKNMKITREANYIKICQLFNNDYISMPLSFDVNDDLKTKHSFINNNLVLAFYTNMNLSIIIIR